jgi:hypothetical protein
MGMYYYFNQDTHAAIPLWKKWAVQLLGKRVGYRNHLLAYEWRGTVYVIK